LFEANQDSRLRGNDGHYYFCFDFRFYKGFKWCIQCGLRVDTGFQAASGDCLAATFAQRPNNQTAESASHFSRFAILGIQR